MDERASKGNKTDAFIPAVITGRFFIFGWGNQSFGNSD
tara:strand:- start:99 stop:212 length:114 start_codon:yes stop_codon:yes gene_type:complete